ncbi:hypothetical protein QBC37DRAFT_325534 [Rhypophila decipiens]|uniref:Uncharacterized protein n=1 Tax=Rhypophila decipiens TaxID=261697 RepID=A0AAN6Y1S7_9PEZI|nr:hypothetical protein QBC37DRAFT_325534 [Rhypophila decipiens]
MSLCNLKTLGNGDIYGLGVRIGLYLQWASGFILRDIGSWESLARMRTVNNVLGGALALAAAIDIAAGSALSVDYLISYYLTVGLFYNESYHLNHPDRKIPGGVHDVDYVEIQALPRFALIFQNILFGTYSLFGAWFWQSGLNKTQLTKCAAATQKGEVAAIVFLFDVRSERWVMGATTVSALFASIFGIIFVTHLIGLNKGIQFGPVTAAAFILGICPAHRPYLPISSFLVSALRPKRPQTGSTSDFLFFHYCIINFLGPIVSIVSVERMLRGNQISTPDIEGPRGTFQTIFLFTGVCSMLLAAREFGKLAMEIRKERRGDEETAGTSTTLPLKQAARRAIAVDDLDPQSEAMVHRNSTY